MSGCMMIVTLFILASFVIEMNCFALSLIPRPGSQTYSLPDAFLLDSLPKESVIPKLIVFDLDHTLWTPELYTLRNFDNDKPVAGKDVWLLPDAMKFLIELTTHPRWKKETKIGVASRTHRTAFAQHLLNTFEINGKALSSIVKSDYVQIYRGNKQRHFQALRNASELEYHEMLFFDDARDGKYGNCEAVSKLGVMSCHCPRGLTSEIIENAIKTYDKTIRSEGTQGVGRIVDAPPVTHDKVKNATKKTKKMKVFSMNQPFASLLAYGIKQLETRNGTMFSANTNPGDRLLLHVGQRLYPDGGAHLKILREAGYTPALIEKYTNLPQGFQKGQVVAEVEVGETVLVEDAALRSRPQIERAVAARGVTMGRYITPIRKVKWLKKGLNTRGRPGLFAVDVPIGLLPDFSEDPMKDDVTEAQSEDVVPDNYTWEGGGGTDVCASAFNDDPFATGQEEADKWELFKKRLGEKIKRDPTYNQESAGSGRWP